MNIQPKQQYQCNKCDKHYFKKGALTTHVKKTHNISNSKTKKEFMAISTNNESDNNNNNNNNKNIEVNKLEVEHAKEKEVDNENKPKIMLGMKITVNYDTFISTPVAVVTKEPKTSVLL